MTLQGEFKVIRERNVMVPMRDGTRLATDVFRPDAPGRFPVLMNRGPYGKDDYVASPDHSVWFFPTHGYVVVSQDCRARFESEGDWYNPLFQEITDGYDTVEWAARQPWSNGRVGTTGQSYLGATQYTLATNNPLPAPLQTMAPVSASSDFHQSWVYHTGGAMEWGWMVPYAIHKGRNTLERQGRHDLLAQLDEYVLEPGNFGRPLSDQWFRHLPLRDWIDRLKETAPYFREYFDNELDSPYWWRINLLRNLEGIKIPLFHISSWYDIFLEGALNAYQAIRERGGSELARNNQRLLVGPWAHIRPYTRPTSVDTGDIDFGSEARIELHDHLLRWFDHWLKDIDNGVMNDPPVYIFVMGENRWRYEKEWPLARTHYTRFYLHSDSPANSRGGAGTLSTVPPDDEPPDIYVYDPDDPVPTLRGNTLMIPHGVADQRPAEDRQDVLVYTSEPLARDLELTGPIKVQLFAASSASDTDFTAKLVDVRPDGYAHNLQDGIVRARYRNSAEQASFIAPGEVYEYSIDLWATSHVVKSGHQLRVEISSSNFPRFDRNPNTGAPLGVDARLETARQTVYHSAAYPSHILLPIIPR
ncbi:MAG: CocE/NonD family hydrolase [Dehalococcoidia bacterium]